MIVKKNKNPEIIEDSTPEQNEGQLPSIGISTESELYEANPLSEIYKAVKTIIEPLRVDPNNPDSPPLFRTIKFEQGQLTRIKNNLYNKEYALAFPAVFIHLINVRWLVSTSRIGEGRADLRICFVLNRLNVQDDEYQTEGYEVFQRINNAIQENKALFTPLTERCQLTYFDQVENFDDGLQQYWITYEVWFRNYSAYRYKNYVERTLVIPPFTNHSDQLPENNLDEHENHQDPSFEDVVGFDDIKPTDNI